MVLFWSEIKEEIANFEGEEQQNPTMKIADHLFTDCHCLVLNAIHLISLVMIRIKLSYLKV